MCMFMYGLFVFVSMQLVFLTMIISTQCKVHLPKPPPASLNHPFNLPFNLPQTFNLPFNLPQYPIQPPFRPPSISFSTSLTTSLNLHMPCILLKGTTASTGRSCQYACKHISLGSRFGKNRMFTSNYCPFLSTCPRAEEVRPL